MSSKSAAKPPAKKGSREAYLAQTKVRLDNIRPGLFDVYQECITIQRKLIAGHTSYYWDLGHKMQAIYQSKTGTEAENKAAVAALLTALNVNPGDGRAAVRLIRNYPKQLDLSELVTRVNTEGRPLAWGHIRQLLNCDDDEDGAVREAWIKKTLANNWSPQELAKHLQDARGKLAGGGRPFKPLENIVRGVSKWSSTVGEFLKITSHHFSPDDLAELVEKTDASAYSPELLAKIDEVDKQLDDAADSIAMQKEALSATREKIAAVIQQNALPAPSAATDDDEEDDEDDEETDDEDDSDSDDDDESETDDESDEDDDEETDDDDEPAPRKPTRASAKKTAKRVAAKAAKRNKNAKPKRAGTPAR